MSLYALMAYNHTFSRAAALSPSLWTNPEGVEKMIKKARLSKDTVLYMDYGSNELRNHMNMRKTYNKACSLLQDRNIHLTTRIIPNGNHSEASWEKQLPFFINTLLYEMNDA